MALRSAALLARTSTRAAFSNPAPLSVVTRCLSGEYNPFTHSLDRLNTKKVATTLDLGDGKTQKVYERIKVEPPPEHAPPIKLSGEVGKITSNIYFYASANGQLEAVEKDFQTIEKTLLGSKEWVNSSGATPQEKLNLINTFISKTSLSSFTKQLLPYFVEQKLIKHLPQIKDQYFRLLKEKRGEIDVFVTSADPLSDDVLKTLSSLITKQIGSSKVNFKTEVDKDLIAGLRIRYKSTLIDNTVARRISAVKDGWSKAYAETLQL